MKHRLLSHLACWSWLAIASCHVNAPECYTHDDCGGGCRSCTNGRCTPKPAGAACDDGLFCNGAETCDGAGLCLAGEVLDCSALDGPCVLGECSEEAADCLTVPRTRGTSCEDLQRCNGQELCDGEGGCLAGEPPACDDGVACTVDECREGPPEEAVCHHEPDASRCPAGHACDPLSGCTPPAPECQRDSDCAVCSRCSEAEGHCVPAPEDTSCGDGVFCNGEERCDGASHCVAGPPVACPSCTRCDEAEGGCQPAVEGTPCPDGVFCNGDEQCDGAGNCVAGLPVECPTCAACAEDPAGCQPLAQGTPCPDDVYCDGDEQCDGAGNCVAGPPVQCPVCAPCNEEQRGCEPAPQGTPCSDGVYCNGDEFCDGAGYCGVAMPVDCPVCAPCEEAQRGCQPAAQGSPCPDGLFCNGAETCDGRGECAPGQAVACDDGIPCTADACDEADGGGCRQEPVHTECMAGQYCDLAAGCWPLGCVRYVDGAASGDGSGTSWRDAANAVQVGIGLAAAAVEQGGLDGCEVWVAAGRYPIFESSRDDSLALAPGVDVYGGFAGDELARGQRDWLLNETILDGHDAAGIERVRHVVTGADGARLDGFTITGGLAVLLEGESVDGERTRIGGAGMLNVRVSPTVVNCRFEDNAADGGGGAIYNLGDPLVGGCAPLLSNCTFTDNHASSAEVGLPLGGGGAVWGRYAQATIEDCLFFGNSASSGGAVHNECPPGADGCAGTVRRTVFVDNVAADGGGALRNDNQAGYEIEDSLFAGNAAAWAGGVASNGGSAQIRRTIFADNEATGSGGGALYLSCDPDSSPCTNDDGMDVENVVFIGNDAADTGGALLNDCAPLRVTNSTFFVNRAGAAGWGAKFACGPAPGCAGHFDSHVYNSILRDPFLRFAEAPEGSASEIQEEFVDGSECSLTVHNSTVWEGYAGPETSGYAPKFAEEPLGLAGRWSSVHFDGPDYRYRTRLVSPSLATCGRDLTGKFVQVGSNDGSGWSRYHRGVLRPVLKHEGDAVLVWGDVSADARVGDPYFVYDLHLGDWSTSSSSTWESPGLDSADPAFAPAIDIEGLARTESGPDVGAYETLCRGCRDDEMCDSQQQGCVPCAHPPAPAVPFLVADLNGNGLGDLVVQSAEPAGIWVYYDGQLPWLPVHDRSGTGLMVSGNLDGEEGDELVVDFGLGGGGLRAFFNNTEWRTIDDVREVKHLAVGDLNESGKADLIADFGRGAGIKVLEDYAGWQNVHPYTADSLVTVDTVGNGIRADLVVDFGCKGGAWLRHRDDGDWNRVNCTRPGESPVWLVPARIGANGSEVLVTNYNLWGLWVYERVEHGLPSGWGPYCPGGVGLFWSSRLDGRVVASALAADLDGDPSGRDELIVDFGRNNGGLWILWNHGEGQDKRWTALEQHEPAVWMTTGDLDGNGQADLVYDVGESTGLRVFLNSADTLTIPRPAR